MNARRAAFVLSFLLLASASLAQTPAGPPQIDVATTEGLARLESVAVDGQGNVTLLWAAEDRTFRRCGPELAFGWDGTFVLAWTDLLGHLRNHIWEVNYQRFTVPPGL